MDPQFMLWSPVCAVLLLVLLSSDGMESGEKVFFGLVLGGVAIFPIALSVFAKLQWRRDFRARRRLNGRDIVPLKGDDGAPQLAYERRLLDGGWEVLTLDATAPGLGIEPGAPPIGDPEFDQTLGLHGTELQRALLGPTVRKHAEQWRQTVEFVVQDGKAEMRLFEAHDDRATIDRILGAFGRYAARLAEPPAAALSALAHRIEHPFDAARALAVLHGGWPLEARGACAAIGQTPIGAALVRVATTGEGLLDPALDWPTRSAIARGVLGQSSPACDRLIEWLQTEPHTDVESAMALVELRDATDTMVEHADLAPQTAAALTFICAQADPAGMVWLQARAATDPTARAILDAHHANIASLKVGHLSLDGDAHEGGLTVANASAGQE